MGGRITPGKENKDETAVAWIQHEWSPASMEGPLEALLLTLFPRRMHRLLLLLEQGSAM